MKPKILIEQTAGFREYYVTRLVSKSNMQRFQRPLRESSNQYLKLIGKIGEAIVTEALKVPGVTEVYIEPYEITIFIGKAHNWKDIETRIENIILSNTFPGRDPSTIEREFNKRF